MNLFALVVVVGSIFFLLRSPPSNLDEMATKSKQSEVVSGFQFEVEGKVQGVYFRKYTQKHARELGSIVGWIRNTERGTVEGEVASWSLEQRNNMQEWLRTTGSPKSDIQDARFQELSTDRLQQLLNQLDDFDIKKTKRRR